MLKPDEVKTEQQRLYKLLKSALSLVEEVCASDYWSYTQEYQLGKLDVAKSIQKEVLEEVSYTVAFVLTVTFGLVGMILLAIFTI